MKKSKEIRPENEASTRISTAKIFERRNKMKEAKLPSLQKIKGSTYPYYPEEASKQANSSARAATAFKEHLSGDRACITPVVGLKKKNVQQRPGAGREGRTGKTAICGLLTNARRPRRRSLQGDPAFLRVASLLCATMASAREQCTPACAPSQEEEEHGTGDCTRSSVRLGRLAKASYQSSNRTSCVFTWAQTHTHTHKWRGENEQRVLCLGSCQDTFSTFHNQLKQVQLVVLRPSSRTREGRKPTPSMLTFPRQILSLIDDARAPRHTAILQFDRRELLFSSTDCFTDH